MKRQYGTKGAVKKTAKGNGCELYKKCGGCQLLNMDYEEQLSFKQVKTIRLLGRFCHVDEILGMENPFHYRNKVQAAFGTTRGGKIISGVYQSSTHNIVSVDSCKLEDKKADEIIVMTDDGIKERGSHDALMEVGGIYKELYDYQFRA